LIIEAESFSSPAFPRCIQKLIEDVADGITVQNLANAAEQATYVLIMVTLACQLHYRQMENLKYEAIVALVILGGSNPAIGIVVGSVLSLAIIFSIHQMTQGLPLVRVVTHIHN
jgi:hypothetical protein